MSFKPKHSYTALLLYGIITDKTWTHSARRVLPLVKYTWITGPTVVLPFGCSMSQLMVYKNDVSSMQIRLRVVWQSLNCRVCAGWDAAAGKQDAVPVRRVRQDHQHQEQPQGAQDLSHWQPPVQVRAVPRLLQVSAGAIHSPLTDTLVIVAGM